MIEKKENYEDSFDLGQILRIILMQSKLILLIFFLGVGLSIVFYLNAEKKYKISSLIQVLEPRANALNSLVETSFSLSETQTSTLDDIITIYKSRANLINLIETTKINLIFEADKNYKNYIEIFKYETNSGSQNFEIDFKENAYSIRSDGLSLDSLAYGEIYSPNSGSIKVNKPNELKKINFSYLSSENYYPMVKDWITISKLNTNRQYSFLKSSGIMEISLVTKDIDEGIELLNLANQIFIARDIQEETKNIGKALNFLEDNILTVEMELEKNKDELNSFREVNKSLDVDKEITVILGNLNEIQKNINALDLEATKISTLYTTENPLYKDLLNQRRSLESQKSFIEKEIKNLPISQQTYIDLYNKVQTTQSLFNELSERKMELSIQKAAEIGNLRVLDKAYKDYLVSPRLNIVLISGVMSFILAIFIAIYRGLFQLPITNPAEIRDRKIYKEIIGVVPFVADEDDDGKQNLKQSIEDIFLKLDKKTDHKKMTLAITSPTAANGKSFVTRNIAKSYASNDRKVLLIDGDWKRGDQHKAFGVEKITKNQFLDLDDNYEELKISQNLYVLPKITQLIDSFNFAYSREFKEKLTKFQDFFDIIIFDTAPILSVSDTALLMSLTDINIMLIRHEKSTINEAKQAIELAEQHGFELDGLIYNSYSKPRGYYGYYGLYGNYQYQYYAKKYLYENYKYEDKD